jgi:ubiquinone/menaquinone biosynthesis C-methylase UbiE
MLHWLVEKPHIYDLVQRGTGLEQTHRRIRAVIASIPEPRCVVDVGGGTGISKNLFDTGRYVCIDVDRGKLGRLRQVHGGGSVVLADATATGLMTGCADVVLLKAVSHHIAHPGDLFVEAARILKPAGHLIFLDAYLDPAWPTGRLLWRYDAGSHPLPLEEMRQAVANHFEVIYQETYRILHSYLLVLGRSRRAG